MPEDRERDRERIVLSDADIGRLEEVLGVKPPLDFKLRAVEDQLEEAEAVIRAVGRRCRGHLSPDSRWIVNVLLADDQLEEASKVDQVSRQGCGYDINEIIVAGPWDGQEHPYKCPHCGLTGTYRAPRFE